MNINDWKIMNTDEEVKKFIKEIKNDLIHANDDIDSEVINDFYNYIFNRNSLTDRAKLFYLESFEDMLISSRIRNNEDVIAYQNSLFQ